MHISEGVLNPRILIVGAVVSLGLCAYSFKKMDEKDIAKSALLSAIFFLASFIHVPVGVASIHLMLTGVIGALSGARVFLVVFVGLLLQGLLFGYGGLSTLGVNVLNISLSAFVGYQLYKIETKHLHVKWFLVGFVPILLSAFMLSTTLVLNGEAYKVVAKMVFLANVPLMIIEGVMAVGVFKYLKKVLV